MSDPKRYYLYAGLECHAFSKIEAVLKFSEEDDGMWVKYEDYSRLKSEVESLKAEKDQAECDYDNCQKRKVSIDNHRFDLFTENKNLKAEVERLTKLCQATSPDGFIHIRDIKEHPLMGPAWEARQRDAKEGKQP